jgi:hypothetical protein
VGVTHVGKGVHEGDKFAWVLFESVVDELIAVVHDTVQVLEESDLRTSLPDLRGIGEAALADEIGCGLGLGDGAAVEDLDLEVVLVTALTPVGEVSFVEVLAGRSEFFDDDFVGNAIVDHLVDLLAEGKGQASDFAVAS